MVVRVGAKATKPPRKPKVSPPRRRRSKKVVSSDALSGFGGMDGERSFGVVVAEEMRAAGPVKDILVWSPHDRLLSFREGARRTLIAKWMTQCGIEGSSALTCSTDVTESQSVLHLVEYLDDTGVRGLCGRAEGGMSMRALAWRGIPILVIGFGDSVHVTAPAMVAGYGRYTQISEDALSPDTDGFPGDELFTSDLT